MLGQTGAVISANFRGVGSRLGLVVATMLCVALVVATLLGLVALNQGLRDALAKSGDPGVALILRGGSQAEINSVVTREQLDILRNTLEVGTISPEVNLVVDGYRIKDGERANISLRGLSADGVSLRRDAKLTGGRWPEAGSPELVVGTTIARTYRGMEIGGQMNFGEAKWTIVGHFETNGGIAESEIWGDLTAVQNLFDRSNTVQSVRIQFDGAEAYASIVELNENDPRLQLAVRTEADYYAAQASRTSELAQSLAWPLAILMAIGAVIGALNTMLASVAWRATEIATLRVMGFQRRAICAALVLECVILCVVAGLIGAVVAYLFLDGLDTSTLGGGITRIGYSLKFTSAGFLQGAILAAAIGLIGAIIPAIIASVRPVTTNLAQ
ncbi:MAG: ABC transporter permease [Verrucomicrobiota bacterium]